MSSLVFFTGQQHAWLLPVSVPELQRVLCAMLEKGRLAPAHIEVLLVRDGLMSWYNNQYMACVGPTNILSFPEPLPCGGDTEGSIDQTAPRFLGSLILSVDTMEREAMLYGQERSPYCFRLCAHGLGHLAGHEHGEAMDALCETMLR